MGDFHSDLRALSQAIERELAAGRLDFPTVLDLSLRIRQAADDPNSSIETIAGLIRIEPVVSARVIRMANSVIFNPAGRNVGSISESIQRIGVSQVRVIALVVAMDQLAQEHRSKAMRDLARDVWQNSIDVAAWAYAITRRLRTDKPETALLAGLMTNIGQLYLIARVGQYPALAQNVREFADIVELWNPALTRAILEEMALPAHMLDAIDYHNPYGGRWPPQSLDEILFIARLAAESENPFATKEREARSKLLESTKATLTDPTFEDLLASAAQERDELLAVLSV